MSRQETTIVVVRHGQTEWNRVERFRGRLDLPLNATGREQVKALGRELAAQFAIVDAVYSSPLSRTVATAEAIAGPLGLTVQPLDQLVDVDYGDWQGLSPVEVESRFEETYTTWLRRPGSARPTGGEAIREVWERAVAGVDRVIARHNGKTVVLVSHKVVCKLLACYLMGMEADHLWRVEHDNAAYSVYRGGPGTFAAWVVNQTCHLREV